MAQLTYLLYSGSTSEIIIGSTALSLVSMTVSVALDDFGVIMQSMGISWNVEAMMMFPPFYVYRFVDITTKLGLYCLLWYGDLGIVTFIDLVLNCIVAMVSYFLFKKFSLKTFHFGTCMTTSFELLFFWMFLVSDTRTKMTTEPNRPPTFF